LWKHLELDRFFAQAVDDDPADVAGRACSVLAINRLCAPGSELAVEERWYPATALVIAGDAEARSTTRACTAV